MKALIRLLFKRDKYASIKNRKRDAEPKTSAPEPTPAPTPLPTLVPKPETPSGAELGSKKGPTESSHIGLSNSSISVVERPHKPKKVDVNKAANYRLPFYVLAQIFELVRDTESAGYPLERVLSVCHFWRDAALDHTPLWTSFDARITSIKDIRFWKAHFRPRANRCGTHTLLDINIELVNRVKELPRSPSGVYGTDQTRPYDLPDASVLLGVLKVFAGTHGAMAPRWRRLTLNFIRLTESYHNTDRTIAYFLQHRTPNLESLQLYGITTKHARPRIFPYAPRLRHAVYHSCDGLVYPESDKLTSLTWYSAHSGVQNEGSSGFGVISAAQNLTFLEIGIEWIYSATTFFLPRVTTLLIPAVINVTLIEMLHVPSLQRLGIGLDEAGHFALVAECKGIPCAKVKSLDISYAVQTEQELARSHAIILEKSKVLIGRMPSLTLISWEQTMVDKEQELLTSILAHFVGRKVDEQLTRLPGQLEKG